MRSHRRLTLALICATALSGGRAGADQSLHATANLTTGFSDNVLLVPENPQDPGAPESSVYTAAFADIAPGLVFAHESPRIAQILRYGINIRVYADNLESTSVFNGLQYQAIIPVTPLSEIGINADASYGRLNAFDPDPAAQSLDTQARGDLSFARAGANLSYSKTLTRSWRIREGAGASVMQPTDNETNIRTRYTIDGSSAVIKSFNFDAFTLGGRGSYTSLDRGQDVGGNDIPNENIVQVGPEMRWVHDINERFSTDVAVGAAYTAPADDPDKGVWHPVGSAYVRYFEDRYGAAAGYRRQVATNLFVAETQATHAVEARGTVQVPPRDDVFVSGTVGWARSEAVDFESEELLGNSTRWVGDLSFLWQMNKEVGLALRFQHVRQTRDDFDPPIGMPVIRDERTRRSEVMIVLTARWPARQAVEIQEGNDGRADQGRIDAEREQGRLGGQR